MDRYFLEICDSTNEEAKRFLKRGVNPPFYIVASRQTAGKGQQGRKWISEEGGLYISIVPGKDFEVPSALVAGSLATYYTVKNFVENARIRFPNDILAGEKKIAGILIEKSGKSTVFGIGINVNQEKFPYELEGKATSIFLEKGHRIDIDVVEHLLVKNLVKIIEKEFQSNFDEYTKLLRRDLACKIHLKNGKVFEDIIRDITGNFDIIVSSGIVKFNEVIWIEW